MSKFGITYECQDRKGRLCLAHIRIECDTDKIAEAYCELPRALEHDFGIPPGKIIKAWLDYEWVD